MSTAVAPPAEPAIARAQRILLEGVPWARYEQLSGCFDDSRALRLTYIDGSLEIMSPVGPTHETRKKSLCYLLEAYLDAMGIRFYGRGGFTLTQPGRAGGEPDDSYCIGTDKPLPDLVIEVVDTSDALSKLPLYQSLGIAEVWLWRRDPIGSAPPAGCCQTSTPSCSPGTCACPTSTMPCGRFGGPSADSGSAVPDLDRVNRPCAGNRPAAPRSMS